MPSVHTDPPDRDPDEPNDPNDPDALASAEELAAAGALRDALEGLDADNADAKFAQSLKNAYSPRPIEAAAHARILSRTSFTGVRPARGSRARAWIGASALIAAAAAIVVVVRSGERSMAPTLESNESNAFNEYKVVYTNALVHQRSTEGLFREPFPREGATSGRVDRIALVRSRDLRDNRFARWGVK